MYSRSSSEIEMELEMKFFRLAFMRAGVKSDFSIENQL